MGFGTRAFLAGGLGFAAAFVVACGGGNGLLSANQSNSLTGQLSSISSALASRRCGTADSAATALNNAVANLPSSVSATLVQNLGQGAATVKDLAARDCTTTTSTATTSSTSSSSSSSSSTSTSSSSTTPTTSSTSTSTSTATSTNPNTGTATNPTTPGTSTAPTGGVSPGVTRTSRKRG